VREWNSRDRCAAVTTSSSHEIADAVVSSAIGTSNGASCSWSWSTRSRRGSSDARARRRSTSRIKRLALAAELRQRVDDLHRCLAHARPRTRPTGPTGPAPMTVMSLTSSLIAPYPLPPCRSSLVHQDEAARAADPFVAVDHDVRAGAQAHRADVVEREPVGRLPFRRREVQPGADRVDPGRHGARPLLEEEPIAGGGRAVAEPAQRSLDFPADARGSAAAASTSPRPTSTWSASRTATDRGASTASAGTPAADTPPPARARPRERRRLRRPTQRAGGQAPGVPALLAVAKHGLHGEPGGQLVRASPRAPSRGARAAAGPLYHGIAAERSSTLSRAERSAG
jgi:hypothetical protein